MRSEIARAGSYHFSLSFNCPIIIARKVEHPRASLGHGSRERIKLLRVSLSRSFIKPRHCRQVLRMYVVRYCVVWVQLIGSFVLSFITRPIKFI